uniref:Uncharacterized protein n=1 Tax=Ditylenchus dipsaci TaxID=166011 RepID=A0A915CN97_9BILA
MSPIKILDIFTALKITCSQLDDLINSITAQLQPISEQRSILDEQYRRELNRGQPLQQLFLVIFQRQKLLAEIEAIHDHFRPQLAQLSQNSFPLRIQILRLKIKKAKTKMELRRWEYYIEHGELSPNQAKPQSTQSFGFMDLIKLIIAFCPIFLYAIVYV